MALVALRLPLPASARIKCPFMLVALLSHVLSEPKTVSFFLGRPAGRPSQSVNWSLGLSFYSSAAFFLALAVLIVPAAVLGLSGRSIRRYGMCASLVMLLLLFSRSLAQLAAFVAFVAVATTCFLVTLKSWQSGEKSLVKYRICLVATLAPLVIYKVSFAAGADLWGFVGISYVTFRAVQVLVEVRDGLIAEMSLADYLYFLTFFATITSGPIDRSRRFDEDAHRTRTRAEYADLLGRGLIYILMGAVGQLVIATIALKYFQLDRPLVAYGLAWGIGRQLANAYLYTIYLFTDFAGYSLMAVGASMCLGIEAPQNFNAPYLALDIKDFWNRWHITLSTWLRDFVFMRLVRAFTKRKLFGSRQARANVAYIANMLVMGLWHGLTADYIAYGLYHGVLLAATDTWQKKSKFYKANKDRAWFKALSWFVTMHLVIFGFSIFSGQFSNILWRLINGAG